MTIMMVVVMMVMAAGFKYSARISLFTTFESL